MTILYKDNCINDLHRNIVINLQDPLIILFYFILALVLCQLLELTSPGFCLSRVGRRQPCKSLLTPFCYLMGPDRAETRRKDSIEDLQGGKPAQPG